MAGRGLGPSPGRGPWVSKLGRVPCAVMGALLPSPSPHPAWPLGAQGPQAQTPPGQGTTDHPHPGHQHGLFWVAGGHCPNLAPHAPWPWTLSPHPSHPVLLSPAVPLCPLRLQVLGAWSDPLLTLCFQTRSVRSTHEGRAVPSANILA